MGTAIAELGEAHETYYAQVQQLGAEADQKRAAVFIQFNEDN
jgi:hypothetical protein